jgi:ribosomal protein S17
MKNPLTMGGLILALLCASLSAASAGEKTASAAPAQTNAITGKVVETMNAASYTYVQLDRGKNKVWAAAPQFAVKVGDSVVVADAMPMEKYHSKTLNRTFDVVYFSGHVTVNGAAPMSAVPTAPAMSAGGGTMSGELPKGHPAIPAAGVSAGPDLKNITRAEGGQTVTEIVTGKAKFAGKPIAVRGRVVKFNGGILGKNWLHLRDGSGAEGTNDLTVTTDAVVKVGDLVLVTGTLASDRDFGSGYKYALIVENAKVVVQ